VSDPSNVGGSIPGSGTTDAYTIEGRDRPETRPVIPLGQKSYEEGERQPRMGFFTDTSVCIGCKGYYEPVDSATQQGARPNGRVQEVPVEKARSYYGHPVLK